MMGEQQRTEALFYYFRSSSVKLADSNGLGNVVHDDTVGVAMPTTDV